MGDEELNFTEEEARCWADDPRNQPQEARFLRSLAAGVLLAIAVLLIIWLATSPGIQLRAAIQPVSKALPLVP